MQATTGLTHGLLIYQAFGWTSTGLCPRASGALVQDGKKLGKRHGATSVDEFRRAGYLPEALVNFLALLGWSPGDGEQQEIFSREELIARFDIAHINLAPAVFSYDKLDWMNGQYIRKMSQEELLERLIPYWQDAGLIESPVPTETLPTLRILVPLVQERLTTLRDVVTLTDFVFQEIDKPSVETLVGTGMTAEQSLEAILAVQRLLGGLVQFVPDAMEEPMRSLARELGLKPGQLFGIVRNAVTQAVSPPLFGSIQAVGRERTLKRLETAERVLVAYIEATKAA